LACIQGFCVEQCIESKDCPSGERCIAATGGTTNTCQPPETTKCTYTSQCTTPLVCGIDEQCRSQCQSDVDCPHGQKCTSNSKLCADPTIDTNYDPATNDFIVAVDGGSPDSSIVGGKDAAADRQPTADGVDAPIGGVDGAATGDGGVSSSAFDGLPNCGDASVLSNGTCSYCFSGACQHGTCVSGANDFACTCYTGYSNTTPKICTLTNACTINVGNCTAPYVCENILDSQTVCRGQFSTTPLSDPAANLAPVLGSATQYPAYSDNGDGTILDQVSNLTWQLNVPDPAAGCAASSPDAGADASAPAECTMADAIAYCASLKLAGHSDWRLPTKGELESLLWCNKAQPPYIANVFVNTPSAPFWTSSISEKTTSNGWFVSFTSNTQGVYCGSLQSDVTASYVHISGSDNHYTTTARCVRGTGTTANTPAVHYTINPGAAEVDAGTVGGAASSVETVTDNWTGLTWQRQQAGKNYADAGTYCSQLGNGFRLPTTKELLSLIDPMEYSPAIDRNAFPNTSSDRFWSSDWVYNSCCQIYCVDFDEGAVSTVGYDYNGQEPVRCVK
jgi:hypothetical protein